MNFQTKKIAFKIPILVFLLLGFLVSFYRGSNFSDGDSFSIILAYLDYIDFGKYNASRGAYGHPIPEFIIGFFSYNFGTPFSNIICFTFFFGSIYIIFKTFIKKDIYNLLLFYSLILSNYLLFIENTNSIDYPIAIFFFSLGLFFLKKSNFFLCSIFFGFAIASRANFVVFIYPSIIIFLYQDNLNFSMVIKIIKIFVLTSFFGIIFYFPVFHTNDYSLSFIKIPFLTESDSPGWYGGPSLEMKALIPRFVYKIYKMLGVFSVFVFIYLFFFKFKKLFSFRQNDNRIFYLISILNLSLFYFMPVKTLLINPFIIFTYVLIFHNFEKKIIYLLIFFNLLQWFISYSILDIKYKNQEICFAKEAISAKIILNVEKGDFINYVLNNKNYSECYSQYMRKYSYEFKKNLPLRLSN